MHARVAVLWSVTGLAATALIAWPAGPALAYVGPGLGAGAVAVVLGLIGSVVLALVAIVWYPVKRLLRKRRGTAAAKKTDQDSAAS